MFAERMARFSDALGRAFPFPAGAEGRLGLAIGLSLLLHSVLLILHFSAIHGVPARRDSNLEVVLVNAKSAHRPTDAQVRAQVNLDGGGNTDENHVAATPLPPTANQQTGDALVETHRRVQEAETQQRQLLAQTRTATPPVPVSRRETVKQPDPLPKMAGVDLADSALAMARLEAKIARDVDNYNKRPRRTQVGVRAVSAAEAQYVEDWRLKVERVGNLNYPAEARGKLYGKLILAVELSADGSLVSVEITRSSGQKVLDEAAKRIVRLAAPYGAFPPELRATTDILLIPRTFVFTTSDNTDSFGSSSSN